MFQLDIRLGRPDFRRLVEGSHSRPSNMKIDLLTSMELSWCLSPRESSFEVALMSGRRAESLGFHNPKRQRGTAFLIPRSVSKECLGQGKNTVKVSPSLTLRVVIILKCATSKVSSLGSAKGLICEGALLRWEY